MNNKLKEIFNEIEADEELKNCTKEFLARQTKGYTEIKTIKNQYRIYVVCACLLFILLGGHWLYFTPTAEISIDINPSLELNVNRFDRIISVNGFNDDGRDLAKAIDIKYENYSVAIERILNDEKIAILLSDNEIMTVTVTGKGETQSTRILSTIQVCTSKHRNTHCYLASSEEAAAAHQLGLSCGKYRAFLEIQALDPDITPETIQNMTMQEIQDLIERLSSGNENRTLPDNNGKHRHHGTDNEHGEHHGKNRF